MRWKQNEDKKKETNQQECSFASEWPSNRSRKKERQKPSEERNRAVSSKEFFRVVVVGRRCDSRAGIGSLVERYDFISGIKKTAVRPNQFSSIGTTRGMVRLLNAASWSSIRAQWTKEPRENPWTTGNPPRKTRQKSKGPNVSATRSIILRDRLFFRRSVLCNHFLPFNNFFLPPKLNRFVIKRLRHRFVKSHIWNASNLLTNTVNKAKKNLWKYFSPIRVYLLKTWMIWDSANAIAQIKITPVSCWLHS